MIEMTATVSQADIADLDKAIDMMIRKTTKLGKDAVKRAAYHFLVSAKHETPKPRGKKNRTLYSANVGSRDIWKTIDGKKVKTQTAIKSKFYVVMRQGKPPIRILMPIHALVKGKARRREATEAANELKEKYQKIPHRYAARNSWNRAFAQLGRIVANTMTTRSARIAAASRAQKLGGNFTPSVRIWNDLSYLTKIAPQLEGIALRSAGKSLLHMVEKGIEKQVRAF